MTDYTCELADTLSAFNQAPSAADSLRRDYATITKALVMAMRAAQNWHEIVRAAEAIVEIEYCQFRTRLAEALRMSSDVAAAAKEGK